MLDYIAMNRLKHSNKIQALLGTFRNGLFMALVGLWMYFFTAITDISRWYRVNWEHVG